MDVLGSHPATNETATQIEEPKRQRRESLVSNDSQTASDFINSQLRLEADAREALPYSFDSCTQPLGALRQSLFSCLTCNPPPSDLEAPYQAAGVCYSCSISCHGEHTLVELFSKRNFVCDCGTTRFSSASPCNLRMSNRGTKGTHSEQPAPGNKYNNNFRNLFCGCGELYDPHQEKGTMFQCLGLGTVENGGCGEDWYHPECLLGLPRNWAAAAKKGSQMETKDKEYHQQEQQQNGNNETTVLAHANEDAEDEPPLPPGFPEEDDFETFICYKCVDANPWIKVYAGTPGFLPPVYKQGVPVQNAPNGNITPETAGGAGYDTSSTNSKKRELEEISDDMPNTKRQKEEPSTTPTSGPEEKFTEPSKPEPKHKSLPANAPAGTFSLFLKEDFRDHLCHCPSCFPNLIPHPQLREEEETYEPPLSQTGDDANGDGSHHTGSLLDLGEAALSNMDRVRAIEGVMVYNHLKDKVKAFLKPFAESGQAVGAEDIKAYFEKLRGDDQAIREAGGAASASGSRNDGDGENGSGGANRREQSGY
ncbi:zinc finger protein [Histoplasma capsulatum var. duboisii H88]|uniref:Zinc finger protein n=2 Tax=Ajellomyces capsulatus TaxID=5037 RepID=F0UP89_AJEC8|nr:zinc finger protein [Histoplasma capsulatum H143]EGC47741.1 zinc finger protein [Histoplasma capsulatum var. duboisii H88]QSS53902.1 zinc finger protein [Histoplasma capsulatum var. duboisii H88]